MKKNNTKIQFLWEGKEEALQECNTPPKIKYEIPETIDGNEIHCVDNLDFLKNNLARLRGKVKCIYIDPPYNTGNDFIYKDKIHGKGECKHSKWLSFMYPRLMVARELLQENGVIFISIDDNEVHHLRLLMNEVFGEGEFVANITRVTKTTSFKGRFFSPSTDYVLCFAKSIDLLPEFTEEIEESQFSKIETDGDRKGEKYRDDIAFYLSSLDITRGSFGQRYFIECPDGSRVCPPGKTLPPEKGIAGDGVWRWNYESYQKNKHLLVFKETKTSPLLDENGNKAKYNIYTKSYLKDRMEKGKLPRNFIDNCLNRNGTEALNALDIPFDAPKPVSLIKHLLQISTAPGDLILDFFAGSGTTGQAVMELNQEEIDKQAKDGLLADKTAEVGGRKFILVQLPEKIKEDKEAFKAGYKKISDITIERVRRAGEKYKSVDVNFQIFGYAEKN